MKCGSEMWVSMCVYFAFVLCKNVYIYIHILKQFSPRVSIGKNHHHSFF